MVHASTSQDPQVSGVLRESMQAWETHLLAIVGMDAGDPAHRAMVRSFQSLISEATTSWLEGGTLDKGQVHAMLTSCLLALGDSARRESGRPPWRQPGEGP
jgi:tryptophan synthase beta subunit